MLFIVELSVAFSVEKTWHSIQHSIQQIWTLYSDVYEHGKLGISVNTSPIMALELAHFSSPVRPI